MPKIIIVHYEEDPEAIVKFRMDSSYFWNDHINFTRDAIISILAELDDINAIADRLIKNQEDIGSLIAPYYSVSDATTLTDLLKKHISLVLDIVRYAKADRSLLELKTQAQSNVIDIASLLDSLDSDNWPKADIVDAFTKHMDLTEQEVLARIRKDWVADIAAYDSLHEAVVKLAETFACGIVYKFPEKFVKYEEYSVPELYKKKK